MAQAARAHAGEVARVAPRGGRYLPRSVVPSAHVCLEEGSALPACLPPVRFPWAYVCMYGTLASSLFLEFGVCVRFLFSPFFFAVLRRVAWLGEGDA